VGVLSWTACTRVRRHTAVLTQTLPRLQLERGVSDAAPCSACRAPTFLGRSRLQGPLSVAPAGSAAAPSPLAASLSPSGFGGACHSQPLVERGDIAAIASLIVGNGLVPGSRFDRGGTCTNGFGGGPSRGYIASSIRARAAICSSTLGGQLRRERTGRPDVYCASHRRRIAWAQRLRVAMTSGWLPKRYSLSSALNPGVVNPGSSSNGRTAPTTESSRDPN
jgi:hypothetical protein